MRKSLSLALAGVSVLGAVGLAAGPAFADTPTSSANATVTVNQTISFAFTTGQSFALSPGVTSHGAVAFTIATNDPHGYSLVMNAPDLVGPGGSVLASTLSYETKDGNGADAPGSSSTQQLSNNPATAFTTNQPAGGDQWHQDWTANFGANIRPGAYTTSITYTAIGNP